MDEERERGTGSGAGIRGDARRSIARRPFREEHGGDLREERGGGGARFGAGQRRGTGDARGSSALTSSLILMSTSRKSSRCDTSTSGSIPAHTRGRPSTVAQSLKLQPSFHTGAVPSKIFQRDTALTPTTPWTGRSAARATSHPATFGGSPAHRREFDRFGRRRRPSRHPVPPSRAPVSDTLLAPPIPNHAFGPHTPPTHAHERSRIDT